MTCSHKCNHHHTPAIEERRLFLQVLGAGLLTTLLPAGRLFAAEAAPQPLPAGRSVYHVSGHAWVNGNRIDEHTVIGPNDTIKTARGSKLVFAVGGHAMLLRGGSHLVMQGSEKGGEQEDAPLINLLRLLSGALLSVSRHKGMQINTPNATIGIRGTGVYLEAGPGKTFFCDCYGEVDVMSSHDEGSKDTVISKHHDKPLFIFNDAAPGKAIRDGHDAGVAPLYPHTDDELTMLEALVGRKPAFAEG